MSNWDSPEKAMVPHSSTLTWRIPWTEEPGRLQSMGSHRVGHNWLLSLFNIEPEAPELWPPDAKLGLIGKDFDVGKY